MSLRIIKYKPQILLIAFLFTMYGVDSRTEMASNSRWHHAFDTKDPERSESIPETLALHGSSKKELDTPLTSWSIIFPLLSLSGIIWAIRKHGSRCCGDDSVLEDTIASEVVLETKAEKKELDKADNKDINRSTDIELQPMVGNKTEKQVHRDPVIGMTMLDTSDWTDDDPSIHCSYSWTDQGSRVGYMNMRD